LSFRRVDLLLHSSNLGFREANARIRNSPAKRDSTLPRFPVPAPLNAEPI